MGGLDHPCDPPDHIGSLAHRRNEYLEAHETIENAITELWMLNLLAVAIFIQELPSW